MSLSSTITLVFLPGGNVTASQANADTRVSSKLSDTESVSPRAVIERLFYNRQWDCVFYLEKV